MRKTKIALTLLVLLVGGRLVYGKFFKKQTGKVNYRTSKVEKGDVYATVSATGTLNAVTTVQVGSQLSGIITKLHADYNSRVKKDQLVAELDPATFAAAVAQGKADVDAAKTAIAAAQTDLKTLDADVASAKAGVSLARAGLSKAQVMLTDKELLLSRTRALAEKHFAAKQDLDTASTSRNSAVADVESAKAAVEQALTKLASAEAARANGDSKVTTTRAQLAQKMATLELAQVNLDRCRIYSPIDGVVISRNVDVGQTVIAAMQAAVLFTIANDLKRMQIDANVDEADIGRVRVGQGVEFTVDAYPDDKFQGKVVQMRLQPITTQNVVTYDTVIAVSNDQLLLRPGMTASVKIQTAKAPDVLKLAAAALVYRPAPPAGAVLPEPPVLPRGHKTVYVKKKEAAESLEVVVGISDGTSTEIKSGPLRVNDEVIVGDDADSAEQGQTNPFAPKRRR